MLLTQSLGTIRMPCLLGACCVTLLASVGKLILNYNSGNLLWCARKLAAKGLMLLHYFVWLCSLKQQQHFSCTSRSVCCSTWYRTNVFTLLCSSTFSCKSLSMWTNQSAEFKNSALWLVGMFSLLQQSIVEEVVVSSSSSWLPRFQLVHSHCLLFPEPSVVVLITGLPDNLRWPPHHFTHTTAVTKP